MERRKNPRVEVHNRVCITVLPKKEDNPASETYYCRTDDLSETGLRFSGKATFKQGQIIEMLVIRGSSYWGFDLHGRVAWTKKYRQGTSASFGIEFTKISKQTRLAWQESLERDTRGSEA